MILYLNELRDTILGLSNQPYGTCQRCCTVNKLLRCARSLLPSENHPVDSRQIELADARNCLVPERIIMDAAAGFRCVSNCVVVWRKLQQCGRVIRTWLRWQPHNLSVDAQCDLMTWAAWPSLTCWKVVAINPTLTWYIWIDLSSNQCIAALIGNLLESDLLICCDRHAHHVVFSGTYETIKDWNKAGYPGLMRLLNHDEHDLLCRVQDLAVVVIPHAFLDEALDPAHLSMPPVIHKIRSQCNHAAYHASRKHLTMVHKPCEEPCVLQFISPEKLLSSSGHEVLHKFWRFCQA